MVKLLKRTPIFDADSTVDQNWQKADPLNLAWFLCASDEERERYRNTNDNAAIVIRRGMELDVCDRLSNGELIALAIQIPSNANGEAEQIPRNFFAAGSVKIDWDADAISGLGRNFAEVRVCLSASSTNDAVRPMESEHAATKRGGGRPSEYPKAKVVLTELLSNPIYIDRRAAKLLDPFNVKFRDRYSAPDLAVAPFSERALRTYLKRFRQESEEAGKN